MRISDWSSDVCSSDLFGELGGLDLDEGGVGQFGQAARDFGLAYTGGPYHEDVLGDDFVAQRLGHLLAAPAVAQGDRHGALGAILSDDVLVEFGDDFSGSHVGGRHSLALLRYVGGGGIEQGDARGLKCFDDRSEEHTSELQSLMRI